MSKKTSGTVRLLLKAAFGMLLAGAIGFVLLVAAYLSVDKTPVQAAAAQPQEAAAQPVPTEPTTTEEFRPILEKSYRQVKDPETGEVRRVPVTTPRMERVTRQEPLAAAAQPRSMASAPARTSVSPGQKTVTVETLRPVRETREVLVKDPKTGQTQRRQEVVTRYVPEQTTMVIPTTSEPTAADRRAAELAAKIRETENEADRAKLREQLVELLNVAFNERRERQSEAIDQLEKQLDELRALYEQRGERQDEIVQRRASELLAEPDMLAWDPPGGIANVPRLAPGVEGGTPYSYTPFPSEPTQPARPRTAPAADAPFPTLTPSDDAADDDPFGPSTDPFAGGDDPFGASPSRAPRIPAKRSNAGEDPFGRPSGMFLYEDIFGTPPDRPRGDTADEKASQSLEPDTPAIADRALTSGGRAWGFGDLDRILELLAEISRLEALGLDHPSTRRALPLVRAKLDIAELDYHQSGQQLRARAESARTQLGVAERQLNKIRQLHQAGATTDSELESAMTEVKQAEAALENAALLLEGRKKADAILRNYRAMIADDAEQPSDATANSESVEPEPATTDEEEAPPPQESETVEP